MAGRWVMTLEFGNAFVQSKEIKLGDLARTQKVIKSKLGESYKISLVRPVFPLIKEFILNDISSERLEYLSSITIESTNNRNF